MINQLARGLHILASYGACTVQAKNGRIKVTPTTIEIPTSDIESLRGIGWCQVDSAGMEETCYSPRLYWEYLVSK